MYFSMYSTFPLPFFSLLYFTGLVCFYFALDGNPCRFNCTPHNVHSSQVPRSPLLGTSSHALPISTIRAFPECRKIRKSTEKKMKEVTKKKVLCIYQYIQKDKEIKITNFEKTFLVDIYTF